MKTNKIN